MRSGLVVVLALGGCTLVFPIEEPPIDPKCRTKATAISDDFADGDTAPLWRVDVDSGNTVTESGGQATLTATADVNDSLAQLQAIPFVDLLDSRVTIQIDYDNPIVGGNYVALELLTPQSQSNGDGPRVELRAHLDGGVEMLDAAHVIDTERLIINSVPYDRTTMNVWRIVRDGESTVWSAGPVGGPFTQIATFALPDIRFVQPQVTVAQAQTTFVAHASHFNDGEHSKICGADELVDDFEAGIDPVQWGRVDFGGCKLVAMDGGVVLAPDTGTGHCELGATGLYDVLRHPLTVEVTGDVGDTATGIYIDATGLTGTTSSFVISGNGTEPPSLIAETTTGATDHMHQLVPYDETIHKYWRFEGVNDGGEQLVWSTSGDGKAFTEFARSSELSDLHHIRFAFGVFAFDPAAGTSARFDNVNVEP